MPSIRDLETNDPTILLKRIADEFPDLKWDNHTFMKHGWDHEVIILDNKLVFRFPASTEYLEGFRDEVRLMSYLNSQIDFPMPNYKFIAKNKSFAGYEIISGVELTQEVFETLSENDKSLLAQQMAGFLTGLHTTPIDKTRKFNVKQIDLKPDADKLREQTRQYLQPILNKKEYARALQALDNFDKIIDSPYSPALIHRDIVPKHLIWDAPTKQLGVIDFSDRAISDPAHDFAGLFLYGKIFVEQVYELYKGPKDKDFLSRVMVYVKRVGVYMLANSFLTERVTYEETKDLFDTVMTLKNTY